MDQPVSFQDDVLRMCSGKDEAQEGLTRLEAVFKSKLLEIHPLKSCYLLFTNNKKVRDKIDKEISDSPLLYDNFKVKSKNEEKWLGDMFSNQGLETSVEVTINQRYGKIFSSIFELKAILEDLRMQMIGGIKCGLDIWELAIIPSLLNNCGTWVEMSSQSIDKLNHLQNTFLQTIFAVSQSCPKPALCWDTATLTMKTRIDKAKLSLLHHIKNLKKSSLAKQIYDEQNKYGWPGLVSECNEILESWKIPNITKTEQKSFSANEWKSLIKKEAIIQNEKYLSGKIKSLSKLDTMKNEYYGEKPYISDMMMHDARMNFQLRTRMFCCILNYVNNPKYLAVMW